MIDLVESATRPIRPEADRKLLAAPLIAVLGALVVVVAFIAVSALRETQATSAQPRKAEITQLTGEEVGLALGLKPITDNEVIGCDFLVQYAPSTAFCLDGVSTDPRELRLLGLQIQGYSRTETTAQYVDAVLAYEKADPASQEAIDLNRRAQDLYAQVKQEQPKTTGEG